MSEGRVATIDADGHVIEPADLWERELPSSLRAGGFHTCSATACASS